MAFRLALRLYALPFPLLAVSLLFVLPKLGLACSSFTLPTELLLAPPLLVRLGLHLSESQFFGIMFLPTRLRLPGLCLPVSRPSLFLASLFLFLPPQRLLLRSLALLVAAPLRLLPPRLLLFLDLLLAVCFFLLRESLSFDPRLFLGLSLFKSLEDADQLGRICVEARISDPEAVSERERTERAWELICDWHLGTIKQYWYDPYFTVERSLDLKADQVVLGL